MPTQTDIASHLGMNQSEVSRQMKNLNLDWTQASMDEIRLAYIQHLRAVAAGHRSSDGSDLVHERVLTERVDRELKLFALAEKKNQLINIDQLRPELANAFLNIKTTLRGMSAKLKGLIDARYDIDFDVNILKTEVDHALNELARHVSGSSDTDQGPL